MITTIGSLIAILTPVMSTLAGIILMTSRVTSLLNKVHYKIELLEAKDKGVALEIHEIRQIVEQNQRSISDLENWAAAHPQKPRFTVRGRR